MYYKIWYSDSSYLTEVMYFTAALNLTLYESNRNLQHLLRM